MNRSPHQSRDHELAGVGCASKHFLCGQARASEPAGPPTTLPITPALGAFIGQYSPRRNMRNWRGTLSQPQVPSRVKQSPAHSTGMRQYSRGYSTSSLHPLPAKMPDTLNCEHMARTCLFAIWTLATCTAHHAHRFHLSHSVLFWAHTCKSFLPHFHASWGKCYLWCWIEWHRAQSIQASQCLGLTKSLCLARTFLSPGGGGVTTWLPKKKKEMRMLVHCRIYLALSISMLDGCIKVIVRFPFLSLCRSPHYFACRCIVEKKKNHTREMQLLRRLTVGNGRTRYYFPAELYLLFMMDWSLQWGFLVGFCVALCFSVSRNSVLHACAAILRIVHDSDSGGPQLVQTLWFSIALDVSQLSLKKALRALTTACWVKKKWYESLIYGRSLLLFFLQIEKGVLRLLTFEHRRDL